MGELAIVRRNREIAAPRYPAVEKAGKLPGGQGVLPKAGLTVSETLQQLLTRVSQAENHTRESHRTLLAGETALAEVRESLERMGKLAREAAGEGGTDRAALQAELEHLSEEIGRMLRSAAIGGERLFLDGGVDLEGEALAEAVLEEAAAAQKAVQSLPDWLVRSLTQDVRTPEDLLRSLGLDKTASGSELLAAVMHYPLNGNETVDYLAALYLGAVIAGGSSPRSVTPEEALEGLRRLMEQVAGGASPDKALEELTNGAFTSLDDFQSQFTGGVALELREFLVDLLLAQAASNLFQGDASLLALLAGSGEMKLDLMMGLLESLQGAGDQTGAADTAAETAVNPEIASQGGGVAGAAEGAPAPHGAVLTLENAQVLGRDLSGVSYDEAEGVLTVGGDGDVVVRGTGEPGPRTILLAGSGTVTLQDVKGAALEAASPEVRVFSAGENELEEVRLERGVRLTLGGGGHVRIAALRAGGSNVLHLTGGAVSLPEGEKTAALAAVPVVVDGAASLQAQAVRVTGPEGKPLTPFDVVWRTLLPGWNAVTSLEVDGKQARVLLAAGENPVAARLWLEKPDPSHGSPVHSVIIRGKDEAGRLRTRYTYLHWSRRAWGFEEVVMYPNPFTVTGGEEGEDWIYEEAFQTLRVLSDRVEALSGGVGLDARQVPFSGRIVLEDGGGPLTLTLDGVVCRVESGRAFDLGRGNDVTLYLRSGTDNRFESGEGFAGISLGDGTSLRVDCPDARSSGRNPAGMLTAAGGPGGAGIGRDGGGGRDQTSRIVIAGGVVSALGQGGGAGIGAGKRSFMGPVTVLGGTVSASGGNGGAGIGGGLNGPVGDLEIRGGTVSAAAAGHAAAIGAGVQGPCGDIRITGTARIVRAQGGDPGADIGACLFGGCGKVDISGGADIGKARLRTQKGIPLQMGEETVTLPQFRLSAKGLGLHRLDVSTREGARAAQAVLNADRRWIAQIQEAYSALYQRLEQSVSGLHSVYRFIGWTGGMVRDTAEAGTLLRDTRQSIPLPSTQAMRSHGKRGTEGVEQLFR